MVAYFPHRALPVVPTDEATQQAEPRFAFARAPDLDTSALQRICDLARNMLAAESAFVVLRFDVPTLLSSSGATPCERQRSAALSPHPDVPDIHATSLICEGITLGVLAVVGGRSEQRELLSSMAEMIVEQLLVLEEHNDLHEQARLLRQCEHLAQSGGWELDLERRTILWSHELYRMHEVDLSEPIVYDEAQRFYPNGHAEALGVAVRRAATTGEGFELDIEYRTSSGRDRAARVLAEVELREGRPARLLGTFRDVTVEREAQAGLRKASFYDSVTGLFNRSRLDVRLEEVCAAGESGALVLIGLDHFARLNTARGRDAGDAFLRNVGERLVTRLPSDTFIARIGGDEFAVLLPGVNSTQGLMRSLPEIQTALDAAYASERSRLVTGSSIGVVLFPADANTATSVLQAAEMALRQAKERGGNRVEYFAPWLRETVEGKFELLDDVRRGLAANEFLLHYQPICDVEGRARGFEALMRWDHPRSGLIGPYHFLAALEDADLSVTLGLVALRDAIAQMRAWMATGIDFGYVAVNLSGAQLAEDDLVQVVASLLSREGVPASRLMLEVTESVYLDGNRERIGRTLAALRELGVSFALDDFGTGYASLAHLKELAIDRIKVDRSFVRELATGGGDAAIVRAVVTLGQALDLEVVAEGVETAAQLQTLREFGCTLIQGYHFARPMAADAAAAYCTSHPPPILASTG